MKENLLDHLEAEAEAFAVTCLAIDKTEEDSQRRKTSFKIGYLKAMKDIGQELIKESEYHLKTWNM